MTSYGRWKWRPTSTNTLYPDYKCVLVVSPVVQLEDAAWR